MGERIPHHGAMSNLLEQLPFFYYFERRELVALANVMKLMRFDAGEVLFSEGDAGDYLGFVVDGKVEISKKAPEGPPIAIIRLSSGALLGELALIEEFTRSATATAVDGCVVAILDRAGFDRILAAKPLDGVRVLKGIARTLCQRLRRTTGRFAQQLV